MIIMVPSYRIDMSAYTEEMKDLIELTVRGWSDELQDVWIKVLERNKEDKLDISCSSEYYLQALVLVFPDIVIEGA